MPLLRGTSYPPGLDRGGYVVRAIRMMDSDASPYLIEGLADPDLSVRFCCVHLLGEVPNLRTAAALPALGKCVSDSDRRIRADAVLAIGRTLENPELSLPFLTNALLDVSSTVRFNAAHALWGFGVKAGPAVPAIEHAITNEMNFVNEGNDDKKAGPKSHARIIEVLTNAIVDIRDHAEHPY
jgi:HEAT repeat protein